MEDEVIVARDIEQQLLGMGYDLVGHATRGEEAVALAAQLRPDLILMDIQLAGDMDGIAAAQAIHAQNSLPIVFLTAFAADDVLARAKLAEPYGYILKPFSERELRTVIEMAFYKHQADTRLRASEAFNLSILNSISANIVVLDKEGIIIAANDSGASLSLANTLKFGNPSTHVDVGSNYLTRYQAGIRFTTDEDALTARNGISAVLEGTRSNFSMHYPHHLPGQQRWFHLSASPLKLDTGGIVITHHNVTDQMLLQQQLTQAQKMQSVGQLTGGIAHDFNNILTSILGYTDLALERFVPDKTSKLATYLNEVKRASLRARDLIVNMLAFSRGGKGEPRRVKPADMMAEVAKLLRSVLPSSLELLVTAKSGSPDIYLDPVHLHQMIMNLCINARDAVGAHGRIEVGLTPHSHVDGECDSCHHQAQGEFVEIWVKDNGSGINPETLAHMFEPFYSTKGVGKGTGLGLSTVHGLVHGYGGHIIVTSTPGSGTTIRLLLPSASDDNVQLSSRSLSTELTAPTGNGELILVVDDENSLALLLGDVLEINGYQAQVFSDSRAALEAFTANPARYAALVTDYTMPGLNGIELTQHILALRADLPVILCSGFSDKLDTAAAMSLGIRRYFDKPVNNRVLMQALDEVLHA